MIRNYEYMNLPNDISGAMSKNRFRNEMLWGIKKALELHRNEGNYAIVFDFVCDIEAHLENHYEFYQLKTKNSGEKYSVKKIYEIDKNNSILGKLYRLKYDDSLIERDEIKLSIVSNVPLSNGKTIYNTEPELDLRTLKKETVNEIIESLKLELGQSNINFNNVYFTRSGIDLFEPNKSLIGEISTFFEEYFSCEPKKINSLCRVLFYEVECRACYENEITSYNELITKKGMDKRKMESIFQSFIEQSEDIVREVQDEIKNIYANDFKKRVEMIKSLKDVSINMKIDKSLVLIEESIVNYLDNNLEICDLGLQELISKIELEFQDLKPFEYSEYDFRTFVLIVLKKYEEGLYE